MSDCLVRKCRAFFLHHMVSVLSSPTLFNKIHQRFFESFLQLPSGRYPFYQEFKIMLNIFCIFIDCLNKAFIIHHSVLCNKVRASTGKFFCTESPEIPNPDKEHNWRYVLTSEMCVQTKTIPFLGLFFQNFFFSFFCHFVAYEVPGAGMQQQRILYATMLGRKSNLCPGAGETLQIPLCQSGNFPWSFLWSQILVAFTELSKTSASQLVWIGSQ